MVAGLMMSVWEALETMDFSLDEAGWEWVQVTRNCPCSSCAGAPLTGEEKMPLPGAVACMARGVSFVLTRMSGRVCDAAIRLSR